jgi:hypothetical protein
LSDAAIRTLQMAVFESEIYWREAIRLRRWDDCGNIA